MGGSVGMFGPAAADTGGVSALSAVVHEQEAQMASQMAAEATDMRPSPKEGSGAHKCSQARVRGLRMLGCALHTV